MAKRTRLLYTQDNPALTRLSTEVLERAGYQVLVARDGQQALTMHAAQKYDVVIVDQSLPHSTGLQVIQAVASSSSSPLTIILIEADEAAVALEAIHLGASDYVIKDVAGNYASLLPMVIERALQRLGLAEKLQAAQSGSRGFFNRLTVGVYRATVEGRILDVNPALVNMLGYSDREAMLEYTLAQLCSKPNDYLRLQILLQREGVARDLEMQLRCRNGMDVWVRVNSQSVQDDQEQGLYYEGSVENITAHKQSEETYRQRTRALALLHAVSQKVGLTLEVDQVFTAVLEEIRRLRNVTATTVWLVDSQTSELVCRQSVGPHQHLLLGYRLAPGQGVAGWVAQQSQSLIVADSRLEPRHFKEVDQLVRLECRSLLCIPLLFQRKVMGVLQAVDTRTSCFDAADLTLLEPLVAFTAIAVENARLYEQAQHEIAERRRVQAMLEQRTLELQARNEELDAFAHTVAHDLKNPLGVTIGFAQVLASHMDVMSKEELIECAQHISHGTHKANDIVNNLLLLASTSKQDVETRPLDMATIVAEALQRLALVVQERQADIVIPDHWPVALGYAPWVEEIWANYISNAIKYGGEPPRVELGATILTEPAGQVRFWVRDNGHGLSPEEHARLFTPFERLHQVNIKGHGLGLSIVKRIVERLGGQVGVTSQVGDGSVFSFTLPVAPSSEEAPKIA